MKILLLSAPFWWWHNSAALNLKQYFEEKWYEVKVLQLTDYLDEVTKNISLWFYKFASEDYPKIWEKIFYFTDNQFLAKVFHASYNILSVNKFNKFIKDYLPNVIILTYPLRHSFVRQYIKKYWKNFFYWVVVTDSIKIQSFWYYRKYVDRYYLIDEISKKVFINKFSESEEKVKVTFFPLHPSYFTDKEKINNNKVMILLTFLLKNYVEEILEFLKDREVYIIAWRAKKLYYYLYEKYKNNKNFYFYEYIDIKSMLKDIWLFIWKAWGAVTCECIANDVPIIVPRYFYWQEEWNVELIKYYNLWLVSEDPYIFKNAYLFYDWNKFIPNFKKVKKNNSCDLIHEDIWKI